MEGRQTTYFRGPVRLRGRSGGYTQYEVVQGGAFISIPDRYHLRLVGQVDLPEIFEIVAPMEQVMVRQGKIPDRFIFKADHAYYTQLVDHFLPMQRPPARSQQSMEPGERKSGQGCAGVLLLATLLVAVMGYLVG